MDENRTDDLVLAVAEAATNAVKHANGASISVHRRDDCLLVDISDHGPGIQAINYPEVALKKGYTTAISLGMGYKMMICLADRILLATGPDGTTVAIEMNIHPVQKPPFCSVLICWTRWQVDLIILIPAPDANYHTIG